MIEEKYYCCIGYRYSTIVNSRRPFETDKKVLNKYTQKC